MLQSGGTGLSWSRASDSTFTAGNQTLNTAEGISRLRKESKISKTARVSPPSVPRLRRLASCLHEHPERLGDGGQTGPPHGAWGESMFKERRKAVHHRTLWISDLHLGSPGCQARQVVEFLRRNDCDQLYLVGDIFDGWKLKSRFYWTPDHSRVIKAILAKARRGTRVHYLTGNHDDFMRQFVRRNLSLGKIRISHEVIHTTADGRKLLVTHGDRFDAVIRDRLWLALAGDVAYEGLMRASHSLSKLRARMGLEPWSLSAFAKHKVKSLVQYLSGFDDAVYYECKKRGLNGIVCGHTHHAEARPIRNGIFSYNSGDWVESCTALREDASGHIEVIQAGDRLPHAAEIPPSRVVTFQSQWQAARPVVFEAAYEQLRKIA